MKKNFSLILGLSIPILMILFVAGSIYLPGLFIHPQYNFLYTSGNDYNYSQYQYYSVQGGKLIRNEIKPEVQKYYSGPIDVKLYIHDVSENNNQEVSFEEGANLILDSNVKSPDGFEITYGSRDNGFFPFFFGSQTDYNARYLQGHNVSKKLNIQSNSSYYNNFHFIGWIK